MIFIDTNIIVDYYIKRYNNGEKNPRHKRAIKLLDSIKDIKIISNLIRVEVINILYLKHNKNKELIRKVYNNMYTDFEIIDDSSYYDLAHEKLHECSERLSINDCIYLTIMEDYDIKKIASFNSDFDNKKGIVRIH